jgi:hypothetical protein
MRLSRLRTDTSPQQDYQGFQGRVRVGPIDPRGGSAEQLPAYQPIGVVRRPFKEPPLTGESGGATQGHAVGDESASRNRTFESTPLQRTVRCEPDFRKVLRHSGVPDWSGQND